MDSKFADSSSQPLDSASGAELPTPMVSDRDSAPNDSPSILSASGLTSWAKNFKVQQPLAPAQGDSPSGNVGKSTFARLTNGFSLRLPSVASVPDGNAEGASATTQSGVLESFTKGLADSSRNAVKAVQIKARHMVSQNKRRYQEGGFDLDLSYITENIIAMGFPAGDMSSGFFGFVEGFYRNHMEEVIKFFETHHKGKYKVYNLCSERLYDASLFKGKVATFPFDDHNCPPLQLITLFCQSAYSWLKEDIENVVVVHCKAGMARTGLMICSLLLFLKFFPTSDETIDYYNQKRCVDGKGLVLPSQIRYVKYFERILTYFNGKNQPGRRCMLRGFRLHRCPYWIRPSITISNHSGILFSTKKHSKTKDLMPEDFWINTQKKGIVVFALPGEPGLTELTGDFKIHFHERQGDFYCWLNTTMTENRKILNTSDLDGFDKRKLPSPGFQVELVMVDYNGTIPTKSKPKITGKRPDGSSASVPASSDGKTLFVSTSNQSKGKSSGRQDKGKDKDDVFSDSEGDEPGSSKSRQGQSNSGSGSGGVEPDQTGTGRSEKGRHGSNNISSESSNYEKSGSLGGASDFKAIAADTSVFTFGDEEDYESE